MRIDKTIGILLALLAVAIAFAGVDPTAIAADEAQGEVFKQKPQTRRGTGEDENIKSRSVENKADERMPAPASKGGEEDKERGGCLLIADNWTPWKVQMFVDGQYVGLVAPWGAASGNYAAGRHNLYAVASFYNAPDITWGPHRMSCRGSYTWQLTE